MHNANDMDHAQRGLTNFIAAFAWVMEFLSSGTGPGDGFMWDHGDRSVNADRVQIKNFALIPKTAEAKSVGDG